MMDIIFLNMIGKCMKLKVKLLIQNIVCWVGLKMIQYGRKLIKWGTIKCNWCGSDYGFQSDIPNKGLRCDSIARDCTRFPKV